MEKEIRPLDNLRKDTESLESFRTQLRLSELNALREKQFGLIERSARGEILDAIQELRGLLPGKVKADFLDSQVRFEGAASEPFLEKLDYLIRKLVPWRKGPFHLFGIELEAEWRSDWKFERLKLRRTEIEGKRVADVGCGNGYYLFRLLGLNPKLAVGFDPTDRYLLQYCFLRTLAAVPLPIVFEPLRSEALEYFPEFFDTILCLGVLYHHPAPEKLLAELYAGCAKNGTVFVETLYVPDEHSLILDGKERYAQMKNVYLIPTLPKLLSMVTEAGFHNCEIISAIQLSEEEQRATPFAPGASLSDFLDPNDKSRTIEGHVRPHRAILRATK